MDEKALLFAERYGSQGPLPEPNYGCCQYNPTEEDLLKVADEVFYEVWAESDIHEKYRIMRSYMYARGYGLESPENSSDLYKGVSKDTLDKCLRFTLDEVSPPIGGFESVIVLSPRRVGAEAVINVIQTYIGNIPDVVLIPKAEEVTTNYFKAPVIEPIVNVKLYVDNKVHAKPGQVFKSGGRKQKNRYANHR